DQFEAHRLGVEGVGDGEIPAGERDVVDGHALTLARIGASGQPRPPSGPDADVASVAMQRARWPVLGVLAALVLVGLAVAVVSGGDGDDPPPADTETGPEVVERFVDDFESSLTGTFEVRSTFTRLQGEQQVGSADVRVVQRFPDRLTFRGDSVSGRLDGRAVTCEGTGSDASCLAGTEPVDAERDVEEQVAAIEEYVTGPSPLYSVLAHEPSEATRLGGEEDRCYALDLLRQLPVAPYGTFADFCFDPATGAPTLLRVERPEAVDVTAATQVTAEVTDADLRLPGS
ncbi:MAG: hypothetical protein AAGK32_07820, partial [Actinomycetota bacterium]